MNQNKLFQNTKQRLAFWYAGVMGVILSICGLGVYEAIAHAHWVTIDREIESVAGALHDSLETVFQNPGRLEPDLFRIIPNLCFVDTQQSQTKQLIWIHSSPFHWDKTQQSNPANPSINCVQNDPQPKQPIHRLAPYHNPDYYIRLFNQSGELVAFAGNPKIAFSPMSAGEIWQTFSTPTGDRYRQYALVLHTRNQQNWGTLQLGRSLEDFNQYMTVVTFILLIGLPGALIVVGFSSWKLAGIAMQPIYQSYQQIQQFTADAAHELRTPLAAIRATLESTTQSEHLTLLEAVETLKTVERQNQRLSKLVQDLLLLSRMDQQTLLPTQSFCCLNDLISDAQEELAAMAMNAEVLLKTEIRTEALIYSLGNEEQLYRIIYNLVVNGIQYTPSGGTVILSLDSTSQQAIIQVKDSGIGIPPHEQNRIFDRFYRVNSDRSRKTGGSGLGLAIVKAIVKAHQGSIEVDSHFEKGSTFTVRFPLKSTVIKLNSFPNKSLN